MGMIQEFKEFALKGNFFDMAVGVVIGGAFGKIVGSMIEDVIMPIVSLPGKADFGKSMFKLKDATVGVEGSTDVFLRWGNFVTVMINFMILAFVLFLVVKAFNMARQRFEKEKPTPAPAGPSAEQKLLTEIRDLLAKR